MKNIIATVFGSGLVLAVALATPLAAAQDEAMPLTQPQPVLGEKPEARPIRPNRAMFGTGAAITGASYVPSAIVAATSDRDGDKWLYVPVVGPWADLIDREGCAGDCTREALNKTLLVGAGLAQLAGVSAMVASFFIPEETRGAAATKPTIRVAPLAYRGGYGLGIGGRF